MTAAQHGRLGKLAPRHDERTLLLASYLDVAALPPAPRSCDWGAKIPANGWGMMLNDRLGDCTCAAAGHLIQDWTSNDLTEVTVSDQDVLNAYEAVSGYNPTTGENDNGAVELDVLNYWRKHGVGGHKITAYTAIRPHVHAEVKHAIHLFGGSYIGVALPISAQSQDVWDVPAGGPHGDGEPGSWGGHAIILTGYDAHGLTCITWGAEKRLTWAFLDAYCDEAYALLATADWLHEDGKAPNGLKTAQLRADLKRL